MMRNTFLKTLVDLAEKDPRIVLLTADLGYCLFEPFKDKFPDRYFNVGVAEQNMVGIATGLASSGFIPFIYSIVPFVVLRPYEFIRNGPILHQLPVRIVGVGAGYEYGNDGATHYGLEDVGVLRIQPGMSVIAPADSEQAHNALLATWDLLGPVYYRLGKDEKTIVPGLKGCFELGRTQVIREGTDVLFVVMGSVSVEVVAAAESLEKEDISAGVAIVASVKPVPKDDLVALLTKYKLALSVEEHYITGGIGSLISEIIAEQNLPCILVRCGIDKLPDGVTGTKKFMNDRHGISHEKLTKKAAHAFRELKNNKTWAFISGDLKLRETSFVETQCLFCNNEKYHIVYPLRLSNNSISSYTFSARRKRKREHFRIVKCLKCGLVRSNPALEATHLNSLYAESQFIFSKEAPYAAVTYATLLKRLMKKYNAKVNSLLEIGCSTGFFLEKAVEAGVTDVIGFEPSKSCVENAQEDIRKKIINDIYKPELLVDKTFDLACSFHVFDHLRNPRNTLASISEKLNPGGYVLLVCHDVESWSAKLFGNNSPVFDVEHIYFFSINTMKMLLKSAGFDVLEIGSLSNTYSLEYWMRMMPITNLAVRFLPQFVANIPITLKAGNLYIFGKKGDYHAN